MIYWVFLSNGRFLARICLQQTAKSTCKYNPHTPSNRYDKYKQNEKLLKKEKNKTNTTTDDNSCIIHMIL